MSPSSPTLSSAERSNVAQCACETWQTAQGPSGLCATLRMTRAGPWYISALELISGRPVRLQVQGSFLEDHTSYLSWRKLMTTTSCRKQLANLRIIRRQQDSRMRMQLQWHLI